MVCHEDEPQCGWAPCRASSSKIAAGNAYEPMHHLDNLPAAVTATAPPMLVVRDYGLRGIVPLGP